jgi:anti-anti-sigma factor
MSFTADYSSASHELKINIEGRFDFSGHQDFRGCYESREESPSSYCLDMADATYLDSSALGMLLLLRDHAGGEKAHIRIVNCNPDVKKILTISNFQQLFTIQ